MASLPCYGESRCSESIEAIDVREAPFAPIRILNHWDNLDGTIERGYAGKSIFWENGHVVKDVEPDSRLCPLDGVSRHQRLLDQQCERRRPRGFGGVPAGGCANCRGVSAVGRARVRLAQFRQSARDRRRRDVRSARSGGRRFWKKTVDEVYRVIPDLGGFVLKADSEGRLGPSEYGRTHADAANAIARALKPHGGILFYRGFVYDHKMDWRNLKNDRATAAYDNFHKLDGLFEDNVVIQIKHGPIDFQVREPASPLFGGLEKTNQAIELQITQEYLGQQRHVCYTVPMWKEVLDFDMQAKGTGTPVKKLVAGKTFARPMGGFVGVSNVGRDANWLGHHLAMANLYGFGRLAWNPDLSSQANCRGMDAANVRQ